MTNSAEDGYRETRGSWQSVSTGIGVGGRLSAAGLTNIVAFRFLRALVRPAS